ncbi:MAG: indole-3-glycerol phosphate synthase TrpC [Dehalococcoidia bacterium]|nr:MAG: indole-3-glycerol phosphate synthase TrpC [Dehalococcoidia bacterium]
MTVLSGIVAGVREDLELRKAACPGAAVEAAAVRRAPARDFAAALRREGVSLIAEVKRASPSRGAIRLDVDPVEVARMYADSGADAISVLTEGRQFGGSLEYLADIVDALGPEGPPVLRKDFIVDPYQVYEARANGADCVLLIAAILEQPQLIDMLRLSQTLGMHCLVEVHDETELDRVIESGAPIIGINNRDLRTLEVNLATFERLRPRIPDGRLVVGESGIRGREDVERLAVCGVDAVLVGEALMTAADIGSKVRELRCTA